MQKFVRCVLHLPAADTTVEVAIGRAFANAPGDMCHGVPIEPDQRKVQIDVIHDNCGEYRLPIEHPEFRYVQDAIGSFILWPYDLIVFEPGQV